MSQIVPLVTLLLLALLTSGNAQLLSNPRRIYNFSSDYTVKAVGAAITACSQTIVVLDDSPQCFKYLNSDGVVYDWACTADMAKAFDMVIYASAGYAITTDNRLIVLDMYSGDPIDIVGEAQMKAKRPWKVGMYTSFAVPTLTHTWVLADNATNTTIYGPNWTINSSGGNDYGSYLIVQLNNVAPLKCLFSPIGGQFMITYEGGNAIYVYSWTASNVSPANKLLNTITGFGEIGACAGDFYNRIWIWDKGCNCLKVLTNTGTLLYTLNLPEATNVRDIEPTRNKVFIHDDFGIIRYDLPALQATFSPPAAQKCASVGTPLWMAANGGSPPYTARVVPDILSGTSAAIIPSFSYNYSTTSARYREPYTTVFTLYDDDVELEFELWSSTGGVMNAAVPASVIPPYSGQNSWGMLMSNRYQYALRTSTTLPGGTISASYFSGLEMWINVGNGPAGNWRIDLTNGNSQGNYLYFDYNPGDWPLNTWKKFSVDFSLYGPTTYPRIVFADYSGSASTTSFIYVDNIRLIPYNSSDLLLVMRDFCNVTVVSPYYTSWNGDSLLKAKVDSKSVSCAASEATNNSQTVDGALNSVVSGGVAPYTYAWSFPSNNGSTLTDLAPFTANRVIYDNGAARQDFQDLSSGIRNPADSSRFLSAPHSYSMDPTGATSALVFFTKDGITASLYQSIEFWVNGGNEGGQIIYAALINDQFDLVNPTLIHRLMLPPIPTVPANGWSKASYPITSSLGTFYGFVLTTLGGSNQSRIYFDDIKLTSTVYSLTVTDSTNCKVTVNGVSVEVPEPLTLVPAVKHSLCYGGQGTVNVNAKGGNAPYTYSWTGTSATTGNPSVPAGSYSVSVSDAKGCKPRSTTVEVLQPPAVNVASSATPAKCYGDQGSITVRATGGSGAYKYAWASSSSFTLPKQPVPIAIFADAFQLPGSFYLNVSATAQITCTAAYAAQSGYCALLVTPPAGKSTLISIGGKFDFSVISAINFWVNSVDSANPLLNVAFSSQGASVFSQSLNSSSVAGWTEITIKLPITGVADTLTISKDGTSAGRFLIDTISFIPAQSDGSDSAGFTSVVQGYAGLYNLSVTDKSACSVASQIAITQPSAPLSVILVVNNITIDYKAKSKETAVKPGNATATANGGTPPYSYFWPQLNKTTATVTNLTVGNYTLVVTDKNGCSLTQIARVGSASGSRPFALLSFLAIFIAIVALL